MAEDRKLPLLERVRFLAIFSQNLDDFFQVRVAGLKEQVLAAVAVAAPGGMSPLDHPRSITARVESLTGRPGVPFTPSSGPAPPPAGADLVPGGPRGNHRP